MRPLLPLGLSAAALAFAGAAHAQGNAFAVPVGGRSALMGNTGTALANDGAAPFLNPASVVRLDSNSFAFSANFYKYSITHFSGFHQPGAVDATQFGGASGDSSINESGFDAIPSSLCLFLTLTNGGALSDTDPTALHPGRQKLSLCFGSLETQTLGFSALPFTGATSAGVAVQSQSLVESWNRIYAGPSYSVAFTQRFAVGIAVHGVATSESFIVDSNAVIASLKGGGVQSSFGTAGQGSSFDLAPKLGALYRFGIFTAGLNVGIPAVHIAGSYTGTFHSEFASSTTSTATLATGTGSFSAAPPVRLGLGLGAEWLHAAAELDATVNIPAPSGFSADVGGSTSTLTANALTSSSFQSHFAVKEHTTVSLGVGGEHFLSPTLGLMGGASLNLTAEPALSPTLSVGNILQERQSSATISGGAASYTANGHLLVGLQLGYGWGQSLAANSYVTPNQWGVVDTSSYTALLVIAGSINLKPLERAVERVEHILLPATAPGSPAAPPPTGTPSSQTVVPPPSVPLPTKPLL